MTQNNDFGAAWTEGKNKLSHNNVFGALSCQIPSIHDKSGSSPTYTCPRHGFLLGPLLSLPSMSKLFVIHHAPDPSCHRGSQSGLEKQQQVQVLLAFTGSPPSWNLELPEGSPEILMVCFSLHTLFCLYFYLCLISLKRDENCFFVNFG